MSEAVPAMPPAWAATHAAVEAQASGVNDSSDASDPVDRDDAAATADAPVEAVEAVQAVEAVEAEPAVEAVEAEPAPAYVGRRRARPVVLGFGDGSELALEAGTPPARALRAMATALGARDRDTA
jgi:hypothetical protein